MRSLLLGNFILLSNIVNVSSLFFSQSKNETKPFENSCEYGVDVSTPIHFPLNPNTFQAKRHRELMEGCYKAYGKESCDSTDQQRMDMNLEQPASQHNYTEMGFKKLRVPKEVWETLKSYWEQNRDMSLKEEWPAGNIYVNHWESPSYMVSVDDSRFKGSGQSLKQKIWDGVRPILEEWVGRRIHPTSIYGIRIYKTGAILATHVDRLPLVTSCIINVDQDVDEPWPIEVYSHDGRAHNVTMEPGDMVLYESSTVLHGRPAPLKGKFFANIFIHFKPVDHEEMTANDPNIVPVDRSFLKQFRGAGSVRDQDTDEALGRHYQDDEEENGQTELHLLASEGDLEGVRRCLAGNPSLLHAKDLNNWQPIHEAARSGHLEVVKFLVEQGADVGARTAGGGTALWWAQRLLNSSHDVISFLESVMSAGAGENTEKEL